MMKSTSEIVPHRKRYHNFATYHGVLSLTLIFFVYNTHQASSFVSSPLRCSLREPKPKNAFAFSLPDMPSFFNSITSTPSTATSSSTISGKRVRRESIIRQPTSTSFPVQLQQQEEVITNDNNGATAVLNKEVVPPPTNTTMATTTSPPAQDEKKFETLETRSAIMEHALKVRNEELETLSRRNVLLQDVVKKLQLSNRNLLDKVHQLQHEKEGIHISTDSQELWPPEMQTKVLREEFNLKEIEWQNAINNAHEKYMNLRDKYYDLILNAEELQKQVNESEEKIAFFEEKSIVDENDIAILKEQIELKDIALNGGKIEDDIELDIEVENLEAVVVDDEIVLEEIVDEDSAHFQLKVEELEATIAGLEKENEDAKTYLQNMRERAEEKRQAFQKIVEEERLKKKTVEEELELSQNLKSELESELEHSKKEIEGLKDNIKKSIEEATARQKEEEERAKMFSKESLDIAAAAVRQAEEREIGLKQELKKAHKKMNRVKVQNEELQMKVAEMKKSIEEDMEKYNNNMELLKMENDWKLEIKELDGQLQDVRESRDTLFQEGLRLREELNEKTKRYMARMEMSQASWDELLLTQKNDHQSIVMELNNEISKLQSTVYEQETKIKSLSKTDQTSERNSSTLHEPKSEAPKIEAPELNVTEPPSNGENKSKVKRFQGIRAIFGKLRGKSLSEKSNTSEQSSITVNGSKSEAPELKVNEPKSEAPVLKVTKPKSEGPEVKVTSEATELKGSVSSSSDKNESKPRRFQAIRAKWKKWFGKK